MFGFVFEIRTFQRRTKGKKFVFFPLRACIYDFFIFIFVNGNY